MHRTTIVALLAIGLGACAEQSVLTSGSVAGQADACAAIAEASRLGRRASFSYDFPTAEENFLRIVQVHGQSAAPLNCRRGLSKAAAEMNLALALSSQGQFRLADAAFDDAAESLAAQPEEGMDALLSLFRAQHELHRQDAEMALDLAERGHLSLDEAGLSERNQVVRETRSDMRGLASAGLISQSGIDSAALFDLSPRGRDVLLAEADLFYVKSYASLSRRDSDPNAALASIRSALRSLDGADGVPLSYSSKYEMQYATISMQQNDIETAIGLSARASAQLEDELPNSPLTAQSKMIYATALAEAGRFAEAQAAFLDAFDIYEANPIPLRYERIWPFIRLNIAAGPRRVAPDGALYLDSPDEVAAVFRATQLVRSANTASEIAATALELAEGPGPGAEAVRAWRESEDRVATLKAALTQRNVLTAEQEDQLRGDLADALEQARILRERRDEAAPQYQRRLEAPVGLSAVQSALRPGEALVQVLTGEPRSVVLFIEPEAATVRVIAFTETQVASLVAALRRAFERDENNQTGVFLPETSFQVATAVFGDLLDRMRSKEKIFFATNSALQDIPLEVLVTENPGSDERWIGGDTDYTDVRWLVDDVSLSYLPSPRNLVDIRGGAGQSAARNPVIAFGDFQSQADTEAVLRATDLPREECGDVAEAIATLQRLPATATEIAAARDALGGGSRVIEGPDFTESRVRQLSESGELADFKIVHFATHGLLWSDPDCISEPALTTTFEDGGDGLLKSSEIRALSLDADLVVLSACETVGAAGQLRSGGESLSGLARAFFSSGARAVVASHWQVSDDATAALMEAMYQNLASSPEVSFQSAMSAAQQTLRTSVERSDPFYWAPFVIIGDGTARFQRADG